MQIEYPISSEGTGRDESIANEQSGFVKIEGESYYRISDSDEIPPFLMNIVSGSNHWMFAASNGALTAGRRNADNALFPYCTQDKLFESFRTVGSCTIVWVETETGDGLWEPFRKELKGTSRRRNLFKSIDGNKVIFEEVDPELGLAFRYSWTTGDRFGFVRQAELFNLSDSPIKVRLLDGIQNVVPYGLDEKFLSHYSNLADAYKKNELLAEEGLGIYYLSSIPTDRAEPSEGLKATVVWSVGLERKSVLLSSGQLEAFRRGAETETEPETRGQRCSYLVESAFTLDSGERKDWWLAADINQDAVQVECLRGTLKEGNCMVSELKADCSKNESKLRSKIGASDGIQHTANPIRDARHRSNTLFNIMRGGVFNDGYRLSVADFKSYLGSWNTAVEQAYASRLDSFGSTISREELIDWARLEDDLDLYRLATEYLPLSFSRRHGDPSRPWNKFSIETQDEKGNPVLAYQGNWRDIFQNWEPLGYSYPEYLTGMISRFLNASTADGYNPYRLTRDGFDWEVLDPDEPWSNIGYWGDHQIIYLLRLLEALKKHSPDSLEALLDKQCFVYAHVPYRIRGFSETWVDPRQTVDYDDEAAAILAERSSALGSDGKLLQNRETGIVRANLVEKLLNPLLAKMSNFVLDGGIWMNTQRPEWNDANNALVGYGVSMVTLCYVHRYLEFLDSVFSESSESRSVALDSKLAAFLREQSDLMRTHQEALTSEVSASLRFKVLESFGRSGEKYRNSVYSLELGGSTETLSVGELREYISLALSFAAHSIDSNRRSDSMYHSYNLLRATGSDQVEIGHLPEMLEGQVAVLSSNRLSGESALQLLDSLRASRLYREDVESYILYPDKDLPGFLEKNTVAANSVEQSKLLMRMLSLGDDRVISKDIAGNYRFNGSFRNAGDVEVAMGKLKNDYPEILEENVVGRVVALFEDTFDHRSFTGRSGTFFAYEGLGSVYWHMVSKLVLAIQENCIKASGSPVFSQLLDHYFESLNGLGFDKSPAAYGAFPVDAYSHTPKQAGAQQPGMTGQVKEDILSRWGELGVFVESGKIRINPMFLSASDFIQNVDTFNYVDVLGESQEVALLGGSLAFTYCQTLFIYTLGDAEGLSVLHVDGRVERRKELTLSEDESASLFSRVGLISQVTVTLRSDQLCSEQ